MDKTIIPQYYAIRALPGAAKNFLAVLLNRHYNNDDQLFYYSKEFNEYFNSAELYITPDGDMTLPCWFNNQWNMIKVRLYQPGDTKYKIVHEHEWVELYGKDKEVRRFLANKVNKDWGYDSKTFIESIKEGYYITNHSKKELDFLKKLIFIKKEFGDRPNIMFDDDNSTISDNFYWRYGIKNLSSVTTAHYIELMKNTVAKRNISTTFLIENWIKFVELLKKENIPFAHPLNNYSKNYFDKFLNGEFEKVDNLDRYLLYFDQFQKNVPGWWYNNDGFHKKEIEKVNHVLVRNPNINIISYENLIMEPRKTNTVFDEHADEIYNYSMLNRTLVSNFENFWGKITI